MIRPSTVAMEEKPNDRRDQRRQLIVGVARQAFFRTGYGGTTMSAIAASLGGSKTTLWTYFRNKEDLFSAVVDDLIDLYGAALRMPLPEDGDLHDVLTELGVILMETIFQPDIVALHRLVAGEADRFPELGRLLYDVGPKRGHERIGGWIAVQMARGLLRSGDPLMAAQHFGALCQSGRFQGHLIGALPAPDATTRRAEVDLAVEAFLRAYAP
ncbi:MAG: TetR/AcrR family transcriptional regulator [Chakrabartia sp.]